MAINDGLVAHFSPTITKGLSKELLGTCGDGTPNNGASIVSSSDSATEGTHYFNFVRASSQYYRWTDNSSGNLLSPMANTGLMTVAFWMNAPTEAPQGVMDKAGFNNPEWGLRGWSAPSLTMFADQSGYGGYELEEACVGGVFGGTWKHYAVVIDTINGTLEWYVDGVNFDSDTFTGQALGYWNNISDVFQIGRFGGFYLNGQLDTIRVYQRLLTGDEIAELYNAKRSEIFTSPYNRLFGKGNYASADPALEGHWELQDDAANTTVVDRSAAANNGVLNGGDTTATLSVTGPGSGFPKALSFDGSADYIDLGTASRSLLTGSSHQTLLTRIRTTQTSSSVLYGSYAGTTSFACSARSLFINRAASIPTTDGIYSFARNVSVSSDMEGYAVKNGLSDGSWHNLSVFTKTTDVESLKVGLDKSFTSGTLTESNYNAESSDHQINSYVGARNTEGTPTEYSDVDLADFSLWSRELSEAEIGQWEDGPEPYLLSGTPSITGTIQRGQTITLDPGVWSAASNDSIGGLDYTYSLYSYSDTSGSDERLEKVITTPLTNPKVLLSGAAIEGRYLRVVVTASNDGGSDPSEVYTSAYTAAVASGSDSFIGASYNALFGKGRHMQDANLQAYWEMQDDAANTIVTDSSVGGRDGTSLINTDVYTNVDGPTNYLTKSFYNSGATSYITVPTDSLGTDAGQSRATLFWHKPATTPGSTYYLAGSDYLSNDRWYVAVNISRQIFFRVGNGDNFVITNLDADTWVHTALNYDSGTTTPEAFLDGSSVGSGSSVSFGAAPELVIGATLSGTSRHEGPIAGFAAFGRSLSTSEIGEHYNGPEPIILTSVGAPTGTAQVGQTLTAQTGTWDSQNNGAISAYNYQWYRADDTAGANLTLIAGATSSTYTLVGADENKYITVRVGASNLGGEDEAERTFSAYTAQVTAGGGGTDITAESGSYLITGNNVNLIEDLIFSADNGSYSITGYNAFFTTSVVLGADTGNYTLTGYDATFPSTSNEVLIADSGTYYYNELGSDATFSIDRVIQADLGNYTLTGYVTDFIITADETLIADVGNYDITGYESSFLQDIVFVSDPGIYSLTGYNAGFNVTAVTDFIADAGNYTLTGHNIELLFALILDAGSGTYSVVGRNAEFTEDIILTADSGNYQIIGRDATFPILVSEFLNAESGIYLIDSDSQVSFISGKVFTAESGTYQIVGNEIQILLDRIFSAESGTYTLNGQFAILIKSGNYAPYYYLLFRRLD